MAGKSNLDIGIFDHFGMNRFKTFTGGALATNAYLMEAPGGNILFDAPQESDEAFAGEKIDLLVITHGHFDHVADAARIKARHGCRVAFHPLTAPMVADPHFFEQWGFAFEIEPFSADQFLDEGGPVDLLGEKARIFHVPGHCPGSLCIYFPDQETLIGGDVLFQGGVGRWDLPGGDPRLLFEGIRSKLLPLGDAVTVLPGHGPATTIRDEKHGNPYLANLG